MDVCIAVNNLKQFLMDLRHIHVMDPKHVLRYLKGIVDYGLKYDANHKINIHGYVDSNWTGSVTDRKSTSACCFSLGY